MVNESILVEVDREWINKVKSTTQQSSGSISTIVPSLVVVATIACSSQSQSACGSYIGVVLLLLQVLEFFKGSHIISLIIIINTRVANKNGQNSKWFSSKSIYVPTEFTYWATCSNIFVRFEYILPNFRVVQEPIRLWYWINICRTSRFSPDFG